MRHILTPEDGRKGALAVNEQRKQERESLRAKSVAVWEIVSELDDVAPAALHAALRGIVNGGNALASVPIESALDAKRVLEGAEIAHRISRLASGQSTSNVLHGQTMTEEEREERKRYLREQMQQLERDDSDAVDDAHTARDDARDA